MADKDLSFQPSGRPKSKNTIIVISESVAQQAVLLQSDKSKAASQSKCEGKKKVVELREVPTSTQACKEPLERAGLS